ncbi:hypothetical protein [Lactobacillus johnsonii]|jgi:hypothetical protein|uniref:Uncharacterized protein n=1 Tax=Lactobacillus johnsonii TaxID=33959 RepID=A0A9X7XV05_LACJH|nr:hypothetical protein [Lactobacillus johnsonii]QIA88652.1 hypothetical protein FEE39_10445 [Lactobacillus johnsonii]
MKKIDDLTGEIYAKIATRIRERKSQRHKKRNEITDDNSVQLLSNIMNNKRLSSRNPYLLNSKMTYDIVTNLDFKSSYELIWGNGKDLDEMLRIVFEYSLEYLQNKSNDYGKIIEDCLLNFYPYARLSAEYDHAIEPFKPEIPDIGLAYDFAKKHLYFEISDDFKSKHRKYFETLETKKLPDKIITFVEKDVFEILKEYLKKHAEGITTYELISKIIGYETEDMYEDMIHGPEWSAHQPLTYTGETYKKVRQETIDAGRSYIDAIIHEQEETDYFYQIYPYPLTNGDFDY